MLHRLIRVGGVAVAVLAAIAAYLLDGGPQAPPRIHTGGDRMRRLIEAVPLLSTPLPRLQYPPVVQLIFVAAANILGKNLHTYRSEELQVKLEGKSALAATEDSVWLHWLQGGPAIDEEA